ncbi:MAG: hypothetical protein M3Y77_16590 [Actinomycetota bacterium]|nr:hypothetical protein [Actinomycetota bacterium]
MRPNDGEVLHFSEDPAITEFAPHVAATARQAEAYVWAVDAVLAPAYWFPRQCPRVMAWALPTSTTADRDALLGPGVGRVHLIEYGWLTRIRTVELYAYRFAADNFAPFGEPVSAMVATHAVRPLARPERVGDLLELHARAGIELRVTTNLWPYCDAVVASTLGFSAIRMRNAQHGGLPKGSIAETSR